MNMPRDEDEIREASGRMARADGGDICAEIESYVATKPLRALLIALLVGIVVGKLIL